MAPAAQLRRLRLTPEEAFVLSRVNRPTRVREVYFGSGLPERTARVIVGSLLEKGGLVVGPPAAAPAVPTTPARTTPPPVPPRSVESFSSPSNAAAAPRIPERVASPASASVSAPARRARPSIYGDFVFPPAELNEPVELEPDRRKEILFLYYQRETVSHYRLLGVSPTASPDEIRRGYHERSKLFHPDTFFRKRLGTYLPKIQDIFSRLRIAYDQLSDPEARRRYDREHAKVFTPDEKAALVQREIDSIENEKRARERRERLLRARGFSRLTRARELVAEGDKLLEAGNDKAAIERYQQAQDFDPKFELARTRLLEVRREAGSRRAAQVIEEALEEERMDRVGSAIALLKGAIEMDEASARARLELAGVLYRAGRDLRDARIHAQRAIALGLATPAAHRLHGEILLSLGLRRNAKRELEQAVKLGDGRAKQLLADL